jgi:exonuclease III
MAAIIAMLLLMQNLESNPGPTATNLSIVTFNCNGLGDQKKLRKLLTKLLPMVERNCIILLQETHCIHNEVLEKLWKHNVINNGFTSNSAGVMVLFNKKYEIRRVLKDNVGRQIVAAIDDGSTHLIIANAYFPNDHRQGMDFAEKFYTNILNAQAEFSEFPIICGGDFNCCITESDQLNRKRSLSESELA